VRDIFLIIALYLTATGCTFFGNKEKRQHEVVSSNQLKLEEESRALTDAALRSSRKLEPSTAASLVQTFLEADQHIEGLPLKPFDVDGLLASNKVAWAEMRARYAAIREMENERAELTSKLEETRRKLEEMGKKYEEERNKTVVKRTWQWAVSTLGIGGIVALCVFFPAIIPIFGSILSWIVSAMPKVVNFAGVVGKQVFDGVVEGVQNTRDKLKKEAELPPEIQPKYTAAEFLERFDTEMFKATDKKHREIIKERKKALGRLQSEPT